MTSHRRARKLRAIAAACALFIPPTGARAAIIQYAYSGIVEYGYDRAGIFGSDENLTGKAFTLVERFDTTTNTYRYVDSEQSLQFGGSTRGVSGSASLVVTIAGISRSIADLEDYIYSGSVTGKHLDFVKDQSGYEYGGFYIESPFMAADYGAPLTLTAEQATFIGNYQFFSSSNSALATYANFDVRTLTVGPISPVPLPSGVALFGLALVVCGITGKQLRRRKPAVE